MGAAVPLNHDCPVGSRGASLAEDSCGPLSFFMEERGGGKEKRLGEELIGWWVVMKLGTEAGE